MIDNTAAVRVTGTTDPAEIAAVLATVAAGGRAEPEMTRYEQWRRTRLAAVRRQRDR